MPTLVDNSVTRDGEGRLSSNNGALLFEETLNYIVVADNKQQGVSQILNTSGLPRINVTRGPSGITVCRGLSATRRTEHALYWDVSADFTSEVGEGDEQGQGDPRSDPEAWVPVYETKFERYEEQVTKSAAAPTVKRLKNSAGMPLVDTITITKHIPIWEFYQFEAATISDETIIDRSEKVNAGVFRNKQPKTLLCIVLSSQIGFFYGKRRRLTRYQLKYKKDNWKVKALDVGYEHKNAAGTALVPYYKVVKSTEPLRGDNLELVLGPLDGNGKPSGGYLAGDIAKLDPTKEPEELEFDIYETDSFSFIRK